MIRRATLLLALVLMAAPLYAGFDEVADALEGQLGHSTWIPFFGVARTFVRISHPDGVHDIQLALFEGKGRMTPLDAERLIVGQIGGGFSPLVKTRSKNGEFAFIYARPAGDKLELVILSSDDDDTVLVRVVADPKVMNAIERDPHHAHITFMAGR